jgi:hypothetical protein
MLPLGELDIVFADEEPAAIMFQAAVSDAGGVEGDAAQ